QIQQAAAQRRLEDVNMVVPIDLLKPIFGDLLTIGRANRPARPWLGIYATEVGSNVAVLGLASRGPAERADVRAGDIVLRVGGNSVNDLAGLFRCVWALGQAGVEVPLLINREGKTFELPVRRGARRRFLKGPVLHWGAFPGRVVPLPPAGWRGGASGALCISCHRSKDASMTHARGTRAGAIARARAYLESGGFEADLARRVAF